VAPATGRPAGVIVFARAHLEQILDGLGWRWHPVLSKLVGLWLIVEEGA
jgi:hypothetical protein